MVTVHQLFGHTYILILLFVVLAYITFFCITNLHTDFTLPFADETPAPQVQVDEAEAHAVTYAANPVLHVSE